MPEIVPYGSWPSPLDPEVLAGRGVRLGFPSYAEDGALCWVESRPSEGGRAVPVRRATDGSVLDLLPPPHGARTRVHEYGGRAHLAFADELLFVAEDDQQLWRSRPGVAPRPLTRAEGHRFAEPVLDPGRGRLVAVAEVHGPGEPHPQNLLVAVDLAAGTVTPLVRGNDFYAAPSLSPDGRRLAFLTWSHPAMPWDAAELWIAHLSDAGQVERLERLAGGEGGSAFQPAWSPDGTLLFALEVGDAWALCAQRGGRVERVVELDGELGAPLWQLGTELFGFAGPSAVVAACFRQGLSRVHRIDLGAGRAELLTDALAHVGHLACGPGRVALLVGWAGLGSRLVEVDVFTGRAEVVRDTHAGMLEPDDISHPEPIAFSTGDGEISHGFLYRPRNRLFGAPAGTRPPLVVLAHGGPTGCANATFSTTVQFWTTRGFAVLDVNYRGSTGYGRAYRERLRGGFGVLDVEDCVAGARHLAEQGVVDAERLIIRGGSTGGFVVLRALAEHDVFRAAACYYGVSDLEALRRETHKFEAHYDHFLVGPYPACRDEYVARSPIHDPTRIRAPVVFFQGLEDKAVPPSQTERIAAALRDGGVDVEFHGYAGEGHGFRKVETLRHAAEAELAFFRRVLRLG